LLDSSVTPIIFITLLLVTWYFSSIDLQQQVEGAHSSMVGGYCNSLLGDNSSHLGGEGVETIEEDCVSVSSGPIYYLLDSSS